jgi:L-iditol 2-dehydrogenase
MKMGEQGFTMTEETESRAEGQAARLPKEMLAAVYYGRNDVRMETVPVPEIGPGELLVRVHTCGVCGTDLKKISTGSHSAPRIFGHETAGVIVRTGAGVSGYKTGDRVVVFHHIPCRHCYYCGTRTFAQCETYKKVGVTAGLEPSGGGFSEYVRVMDWIVRDGGVVPIPDAVSYEQASFLEPVSTCVKAIEGLAPKPGETVLVIGQGPIGLILGVLAKREGARVIASDLFPGRLTMSQSYGLTEVLDASRVNTVERIHELTEGRGADAVILAVGGNALVRPAIDAARPGGRVMLFAQTQHSEVTIDAASVCVDEKTLLGSYSVSVDLNERTAKFVMGGAMDLARLYSHRFPLENAIAALGLAASPQPDTMKIAIQPGAKWEG